ncbi:uncharacterized protein L203_101241 [Cryptococcus depauperatus CBS 7841]|uniref:Uncharacterized protein n=1 Tax=Cryptococcus depauperatus CBS 7841 TaxID=1295531 RepID=A0A1E3ICE1_9TREE|nr:hypothetical protein L203_04402 [Cryptococcus depauperatus CBS 7841]
MPGLITDGSASPSDSGSDDGHSNQNSTTANGYGTASSFLSHVPGRPLADGNSQRLSSANSSMQYTASQGNAASRNFDNPYGISIAPTADGKYGASFQLVFNAREECDVAIQVEPPGGQITREQWKEQTFTEAPMQTEEDAPLSISQLVDSICTDAGLRGKDPESVALMKETATDDAKYHLGKVYDLIDPNRDDSRVSQLGWCNHWPRRM